MPAVITHRPMLAALVSLLAAVAILFPGRRPNLRESRSFLADVIQCALVFSLLSDVLTYGALEATYIEPVPGLALHFRADLFGLIFALLASSLWLLTTLYSVGYMRPPVTTVIRPVILPVLPCVFQPRSASPFPPIC